MKFNSIDLWFSDVLLAENMDVDLYTNIRKKTLLKATATGSYLNRDDDDDDDDDDDETWIYIAHRHKISNALNAESDN